MSLFDASMCSSHIKIVDLLHLRWSMGTVSSECAGYLERPWVLFTHTLFYVEVADLHLHCPVERTDIII